MMTQIGHRIDSFFAANPFRRYGLLFLIDLLLRVPVLWLVAADPSRAVPMGDPPGYLQLALNLAERGVYSQSAAAPFLPEAARTPGYPLFLAAIFVLAGSSMVAVAAVQSLLHAASALLIARLGGNLFGSTRIGFAGALLWSIAPIPAIFCGILLTETLFTPIFLSVLLLLSLPSVRRVLAAGALMGLGMLVRPIGLLVWPALGPSFFIGTPARKAIAGFLAFSAVLAAVVSPWVIRNAAVFGRPTLASVQGVNILYNNVSGYIAWRDGLTLAEARDVTEQLYAEYVDENDLHPAGAVEVSDAETALAIRLLLADPLRAAWFNLLDSLNGFRPGASYMFVFLSPGTLEPDDVTQGELSPAISNINRPEILLTTILLSVFYFLLFLFAAAGFVQQILEKKWKTLALFGIPAFVFLYLPGISSNARFRIPIEPLFCLLAAAALAKILPRIAARIPRKPAAPSEAPAS